MGGAVSCDRSNAVGFWDQDSTGPPFDFGLKVVADGVKVV